MVNSAHDAKKKVRMHTPLQSKWRGLACFATQVTSWAACLSYQTDSWGPESRLSCSKISKCRQISLSTSRCVQTSVMHDNRTLLPYESIVCFISLLFLPQCGDKDLVERLAGLKQLPENGQLFTRSQWQREVTSYRIWSGDDDVEDAKEDEKEANESWRN